MFKDSNKIKQLEAMMDKNDLEGFKILYEEFEAQGVKIDTHVSPFGHNGRYMLGTALLENKPDFVRFLAGKISAYDLAGIAPSYQENGKGPTYRASVLYLAIRNGMDDIALQMINNPDADLSWGKEQQYYNGRTTSYETIETPFDLAARAGSPPVIDALYTAQIADLNAKARKIEERGHFFKKHRINKKLSLVAEFTQARDKLLKQAGYTRRMFPKSRRVCINQVF